jgi:hypothetical protein
MYIFFLVGYIFYSNKIILFFVKKNHIISFIKIIAIQDGIKLKD